MSRAKRRPEDVDAEDAPWECARGDQISPEDVTWLWDQRIPNGGTTFLDGDVNQGKSAVALDLAARVTRGKPMPDGTRGPKGSVLIFTTENSPGHATVPRLLAAGADMKRVFLPEFRMVGGGRPIAGRRYQRCRAVVLPGCTDLVADLVRRENVKLVIIDPRESYMAPGLNPREGRDFRAAFDPLSFVAEELGCAILLIGHPNKDKTRSTLYRIPGNQSVVGTARAALFVDAHPEDPDKKLFITHKWNLASSRPANLAFSIKKAAKSSKVAWHDAQADADPTPEEAEENAKKLLLDEAKRLIRTALSDGKKPACDVIEEGVNKAGISSRTMQEARAALGVTTKQGKDGSGQRCWNWIPPKKWPEGG